MLSIITHYLSAEGAARFPVWFEQLEAALRSAPGFVALRAWSVPELPHARVVTLELRSASDTAGWVSSPVKARLLEQIAGWSERPYDAVRIERLSLPR